MKKYILLIIGTICLVGCEKKPSERSYYNLFRSYIARYTDVSGFEIRDSFIRREVADDGYNTTYYLGLVIDDAEYTINDEGCYNEWGHLSEGDAKDVYDSLCLKYNDMNFNRELYCSGITGMPEHNGFLNYLASSYVSIDIVCGDVDYDDNHPAGSSLNDIVLFSSESQYKYIESGYNDNSSRKVEKLVSELELDDLKLLLSLTTMSRGILYFTGAPSVNKIQDITIIITMDDGRVFEKTVQVSWE